MTLSNSGFERPRGKGVMLFIIYSCKVRLSQTTWDYNFDFVSNDFERRRGALCNDSAGLVISG